MAYHILQVIGGGSGGNQGSNQGSSRGSCQLGEDDSPFVCLPVCPNVGNGFASSSLEHAFAATEIGGIMIHIIKGDS